MGLTGSFLFVLLGISALPAGSAATPSSAAERLDPASVYALVVGVLEWKDSSLSSFSKELRKDRELFDLLGERGVPNAQRVLLLDEKATTKRIRRELSRLARRTPPGSTFLFYYAGHGMKSDRNEVYFASSDALSRKLEATALAVKGLVVLLAKPLKASRVILMADCCYSGALAEAAAELRAAGLSAVALTSAEASNTSSGNWTFTQAVIDALRGRALIDRDGDGSVSLEELAREVSEVMKYREEQRSGYANFGVPAALSLAVTAPDEPLQGEGPSAFSRGSWALVERGGHESFARVLGSRRGELLASFYDYNAEAREWILLSGARPSAFKTYPVGASLEVLWGGQSYEARILRVEDVFHFITYPRYASSWDEWVMQGRIVGPFDPSQAKVARPALVEWERRWWEASVKSEEAGRACVHYVGYADSWDECVGPERIRYPEAGGPQ